MEPGFMPLSIYCVQMAPKWSCVLDSQPIQGKDMSVQVYYDQFCTWRSKLEAVNYIGDEESYIDEFLYGLKMDLVVRMWAHERKPCSLYDAFSRALIEESSISWTELSRNHNADKVFDEMPHPKSVCRAAVQAVPDAKSNGVRQLLDSEEETAIEIISEQNDSENDEEGDFLHLKADNPLVEMVGQFFPSKPEIVEDAHHMFDEMLRPVSVSRNSDASFFRVEGNDYLSSKLKGLQFGWQLFDIMPKRISAELNKEMYAIQDYTSPFGYFQQIFDTGSSFLNYDGVILSFDPGGCSLSQMGSSSSLLRVWDWTDFFYPNWGDNFGLTARIIFSVFEHLVSIGVIGVDVQSYVWKPGQYMIPYILEDKDVVKRNGIGVRLALTQDEEPNGILKIDLRYKEVFYIPAIVVVKKNAQHEGESIVKAKKDEHSEVKKLKNMEIIPPMVSQVIETPTLYDPFTYLYVQINRRSFPTKFELYLGDLYLHNGISLANGCRKDDIVFLCDTDLYAYFNWMELAGVLLFDTSEVDGSEVDKMNEWQQKCGGQFMTKMEGMVTPISSKWCGISNFHVHCFMNEFVKLLCRCYLPMEDKGHYSITILQLIARSAISMDIIQVWEVCWTSLPGLKFPEIAKPLVADGSAKPHKMLLAFNNEGLNKLKPPTVLHEFVNEGGVIFKVYVVEDCVKYVKSKSLPDVDEESSGNLEGCLTFLQVSNLNAFENNFEGYCKLVRLEDIEYSLMALVTDIARGLKEATKLNLFYFDVIRYTSYGNRYLVIDINYFPGYAKMPNYETILTDFVWDVLSKRYQCSGKVEKMANCEDEKRLLLVENTKILEDENGGFVSDLEREEQLLRKLKGVLNILFKANVYSFAGLFLDDLLPTIFEDYVWDPGVFHFLGTVTKGDHAFMQAPLMEIMHLERGRCQNVQQIACVNSIGTLEYFVVAMTIFVLAGLKNFGWDPGIVFVSHFSILEDKDVLKGKDLS